MRLLSPNRCLSFSDLGADPANRLTAIQTVEVLRESVPREVVAGFEELHHRMSLERLEGSLWPIVSLENDVRIDPCDAVALRGQLP